jgi:hypothetical protein
MLVKTVSCWAELRAMFPYGCTESLTAGLMLETETTTSVLHYWFAAVAMYPEELLLTKSFLVDFEFPNTTVIRMTEVGSRKQVFVFVFVS